MKLIYILPAVLAMFGVAQASATDDGQSEGSSAADSPAAVQSMQYVLQRAELLRMLAAEHLIHIDSMRDKSEIHLIDDAAQVMAFTLVCNATQFAPEVLNTIAAETTMQIALKIEGSPIQARMTNAMGELTGEKRLNLVADVSSMVLMFKVGRRRGLFDALLTDFGTKRFCAGMQTNMLARYNGLAAELAPSSSNQ